MGAGLIKAIVVSALKESEVSRFSAEGKDSLRLPELGVGGPSEHKAKEWPEKARGMQEPELNPIGSREVGNNLRRGCGMLICGL